MFSNSENKEVSNSSRAVTTSKLTNQKLETLGINEKTTTNLSGDPTTSDNSNADEVNQEKVNLLNKENKGLADYIIVVDKDMTTTY